MQAVLRLAEDGVGMLLEDLGGDLLAPVSRQAVEDVGAGSGRLHDAFIDLIAGELRGAMVGLLLLAHADPDIGVEDVGSPCGLLGVFRDGDLGIRAGKQIGGRAVAGRAGKTEFEAQARRGPDPGSPHVAVGVADEGDLHAVERATEFPDRLQVGQNLAGMLLVGEGVDGRDAGKPCKGFDIGLLEGADNGSVDHPTKDPRGVFDRFPATQLDLAGGEEEDIAAEFADTDLETDARAGRGLGEEETPALAGKGAGGVAAPGFLEPGGEVEDPEDLGLRERLDREQVFHGKGGYGGTGCAGRQGSEPLQFPLRRYRATTRQERVRARHPLAKTSPCRV